MFKNLIFRISNLFGSVSEKPLLTGSVRAQTVSLQYSLKQTTTSAKQLRHQRKALGQFEIYYHQLTSSLTDFHYLAITLFQINMKSKKHKLDWQSRPWFGCRGSNRITEKVKVPAKSSSHNKRDRFKELINFLFPHAEAKFCSGCFWGNVGQVIT